MSCWSLSGLFPCKIFHQKRSFPGALKYLQCKCSSTLHCSTTRNKMKFPVLCKFLEFEISCRIAVKHAVLGSYNVNIFTHSPSACFLLFIRAWANHPILQKNQKISTTYLISSCSSDASFTWTDMRASNQLPFKLISIMIDVNNIDKHRHKWSRHYLVALKTFLYFREQKILEYFWWWAGRMVLYLPCYVYCTGQNGVWDTSTSFCQTYITRVKCLQNYMKYP